MNLTEETKALLAKYGIQAPQESSTPTTPQYREDRYFAPQASAAEQRTKFTEESGLIWNDEVRRLLAKYGLADYTDDEKQELQQWGTIGKRGYGNLQGYAEQLNKYGYADWQRDRDYRRGLGQQIQEAQSYLKTLTPDSMTYKDASAYLRSLQEMEKGFQSRQDYYGQFQDETEWKAFEDTYKGLADYQKQGKSNADYAADTDAEYQQKLQQFMGLDKESDYEVGTQGYTYSIETANTKPGGKAAGIDELDEYVRELEYGVEYGMGRKNGQMVDLDDADIAAYQQELDRVEQYRSGMSKEYRQKEDAARQDALHAKYAAAFANAAKYADLPQREDFSQGVAEGEQAFAAVKAQREAGKTSDRDRAIYANMMPNNGLGGVSLAGAKMTLDEDTSYKEPRKDWTEEQLNTFFYLFRSSQEEAEQYALDVNNGLNAEKYDEQQQKLEEWTNRNGWTRAAGWGLNVVSSPFSLADYFSKAVEYNARGTITQRDALAPADAADTMMSAASRYLNEKGTIREDIPVLGGKGWGDAFQWSNSLAKSAAAATMGGGAANILFFGDAANQGFKEAKERGATDEQALTMGAWNGAAEVLGETFSVEKLIHLDSPATFKKLMGNVLKQAFTEGSEEGFTTLLNTMGDAWVMGDKSELNTKIREYQMAGMSREEAEKKAFGEWWNDLGFDVLSGALSGGVSAGGQQTIASISAGRTEYSGTDRESLLQMGLQEKEGSKARELAERIREQGTMSEREAERLAELTPGAAAMRESQTNREREQLRQETTARLQERDVEVTPEAVEAVVASAMGEELSRAQKKTLKNSSLQQVAEELQSGRRQEAADRFLSAQIQRAATRQNKKAEKSGKSFAVSHSTAKADTESSVVIKGQEGSGTIQSLTRDESGKLQAKVKTESGETQTVSLEEIDFGESGLGELIQELQSQEDAPAMFTAYPGGMSIGSFINAWNVAKAYGRNSSTATAESVMQDGLLEDMPAELVRVAFDYGRRLQQRDRAAREQRKAEEAKKETEEGQTATPSTQSQARNDKEGGQDGKSKGGVSYDGATVDGVKLKAVNRSRLNQKQKAQIQMLELLGQKTGIQFQLFESELGKNGRFQGANGMYKDGVIYIDVNAGRHGQSLGQVAMVRTAAHELTHYIQDYAEGRYDELKQFLLDNLIEWNGKDLGDMAAEKLQRDHTGKLSFEEALDEVVADGCEMMLRRTKVMQTMAQEKPGLFRAVKEWMKNWVKTVREAFQGVSEVHEEARAVAQMELDRLEKFTEMWDRGLIEATENAQKSPAKEGGETKYSIDPNFERNFERWLSNSRPNSARLKVGTTSNALQAVGIPAMSIYWWSNSIKHAQKLHPEISDGVIKQVPALIEDPIIIMESKTQPNSITILGEVYGDNEIPAMAVLRFTPNKDGVSIDKLEIVNSYTKTRPDAEPTIKGTQELINTSTILYVDPNEKRTNTWLDDNRLQLPLVTTYGPINKITLTPKDVKGNFSSDTKEPTKTPMQLAYEKAAQKQEREELPDDRALLMVAEAKGRNAEVLTAYQKKVKSLEALERKLQRQQEALEKAKEERKSGKKEGERAAEGVGPYKDEGAKSSEGVRPMTAAEKVQALEEGIRKTEASIRRAENKLNEMERSPKLRQEAEKALAAWRTANPNEAARALREMREEQESLKKYVQLLREEAKLTTPETIHMLPSDVRKMARALVKQYGSEAATDSISEKLQSLAEFMAQNLEGADTGYYVQILNRARQIAREIVENSYEELDDNKEIREGIGGYLRNHTLNSEQVRGDIADFDQWRKAHMGTLRLGKDGMNISQAYSDLQSEFGEHFFPSDIVAVSDQLQQMLDALDEVQPSYQQTFNGVESWQATEALGNEIVDRLLSGEVREKETMADKAFRRRMVQEKVHELRERSIERDKKYKKRISIDKKVTALSKIMLENSGKRHVADAWKESIGGFLASIDTLTEHSGEKSRSFHLERIEALQRMVERQQARNESRETGDEGPQALLDINPFLAEMLEPYIKMARDSDTGRITVSRMELEQMAGLEEVLTSLREAVDKANRMLADSESGTVSEIAGETIEHLEPLGKGKTGGMIRRFLSWDNLTPVYFFKRFGPAGEKIFRSFQKGWGKLAFNAQQIIQFTKKAYTAKEARAWEKETHEFRLVKRESDLSGRQSLTKAAAEGGPEAARQAEEANKEPVTVSTAQLMGLYCLVKREQALGHVLGGGIRIWDINAKKGTTEQADRYLVSAEDISTMCAALTDRQREVADMLQNYMNTVGSGWGNEVSKARFGVDLFTEKNYYPIETDPKSRNARSPEADGADLFHILNMGFTKSTVKNAKNGIVLHSIFDVFSNHMADMAKYNAMGLPMLDAMKWFNYLDETDGKFTSVRASIEKAYGKNAEKYFLGLMQDLNGSFEGGRRGEDIGSRMVSHAKVSAVGGNLRVAALQPTSYIRALAVLDPKYLLKGDNVFKIKQGIEEAQKYSGTAVWKSLGFYDMNINANMRDLIKHADGTLEKIREASMIGAELGDKITWGRLWNATKAEVRAKTGLGGEALLQATAERFDDVIYQTQVMDSTMTRSHLMRQKGLAAGMMTSFMSEPTLSYNLLLDGVTQWQNAKRSGKGVQEAGKLAARAFTVYAISQVAASLVESIFDAIRDDDDYEDLWEKWKQSEFGLDGNLVQDLVLHNKLPYVRDIVSIMQGFTNKRMDTEWMEYWMTAGKAVIKDIQDEDFRWGTAYKCMKALSTTTGLPIANTVRDGIALWNSTVVQLVPDWKLKTIKTGSSKPEASIKQAFQAGALSEEDAIRYLQRDAEVESADKARQKVYEWGLDKGEKKYDSLLAAVRAGDSGSARAQWNTLLENGYDEKALRSAVRSAAKEWYQGTAEGGGARMSKQKAIETLVQFGGMRQKDAEETVQEWTSYVSSPEKLQYDEIREAFMDGEISAERAAEMRALFGGKSEEEAADEITRWRCEKETGISYADLKNSYLDGEISAEEAVRCRVSYGGQNQDAAEKEVLKWRCEKETGVAWDEIREAYLGRKISGQQVRDMLMTYGGKSADDAEELLLRYDFAGNDPNMEDISVSAATTYYMDLSSSGISKETWYTAWKSMNKIEADKDRHGKTVRNSKQKKIMEYINGLKLTPAQKDLIFLTQYDNKNTLKQAPWRH